MTDKGISRTISGAETPYPDDDVEGEASCPVCKGSGWVRRKVPRGHPDFGQVYPCACFEEQSRRQQQWRLVRSSNLGPLAAISFDSLGFTHTHSDASEEWLAAVEASRRFANEPTGWLVLTGASGSGKTRLAAAITNQCLARGQPALYMAVADLLDHLRAAYGPDSPVSYDQLFEQVRNVPVLVLDDLGAHSTTPWAQEKLLQVLNHRFNGGMPTVVTLQHRLEEMDQGLRNRLESPALSVVLKLPAPDSSQGPQLRVLGALSDKMLKEMTFDRFEPSGSADATQIHRDRLEAAYQFARNYARAPQGWLLLTGPAGCGKTHLSVAILNERLKAGERCCFALVPDLLDHLRASFAPDSRFSYDQRFDEIKGCPLLVLDNLGAERNTSWAEEKLFQLVEYRYNLGLPTVVNSTEKLEDLETTKPRIASRLNDVLLVQWIPIEAPDYRHQGAKKTISPRREPSPRFD